VISASPRVADRLPGYVRSDTVRRLAPMVFAAVASLAVAMAISHDIGVPIRDPDGVVTRRPFVLFALILVFWLADVLPRGLKRAPSRRWADVKPAVRAVIDERWSLGRAGAVLVAVFSFYATYLAYRNIKSFEPLVRAGSDWDRQLGSVDQWLFAGHDPGQLLHSILGTGAAAYVLSVIYVAFLTFVPLSLGAALVWSRSLDRGLFYALALSLNWILGAASYYVFPSVGPAFANPGAFGDLPVTPAIHLQQSLLIGRIDFLHHPAVSGTQGVAAFASLHASIVFTGVLVATILRMRPAIVRVAWVYFGLTLLSTVYLGWHYVLDDIAGIGIGLTSVGVAALALRHPLPTDEWRAKLRAMAIPLNAPNVISLARIAMVPVLVAIMVDHPEGSGLALAVFLLAFVSDMVDGHLARSRGLITDAGKLLDPLADKLLVVSSLLCLVAAARVPGWLVLVIIGREAGVSLLRAAAAKRGFVIAASPLGKAKMGIQALFLATLIAGAPPRAPVVLALMAVTAAITVVSGLDYVVNLRRRAEPATDAPVVAATARTAGP
jgi:CDP-diacylglycerol--glycerol-3-phosphate 3-phosphatidyltransferase